MNLLHSKMLNSYEKSLRNPSNGVDGLNPSEYDVQIFLSKLGDVEKISEDNNNKNPDFIIKDKKLVFEVKSINTIYGEKVDKNKIKINLKDETSFIEKFNFTLRDIEKKFDNYPDNFPIGAIWIEHLQHTITSSPLNFNEEFARKTDFIKTKLDGLLIYFEQAGGRTSNKKPVLFSKNSQLNRIFSDQYSNNELTVITFFDNKGKPPLDSSP